MRPEVKARENRFEVRRTQLTGSTGRLASRGQANDIAPRQIVVFGLRHRTRQSIAKRFDRSMAKARCWR
jgi:hypothetical protein